MREFSSLHVETIRQGRAGDRQSLQTVAERTRERVYPYIRRVVLDEHVADDLTQETLAKLLTSLGSLERVDRFWFWALAIASKVIAGHFRQRSQHKDVLMSSFDETYLWSVKGVQAEGWSSLARKELAELTHAAMTDVSEQHRMVLILRVFEDMPYAEIARVLDTSVSNVRTTFFRARKSLIRALRRRGVERAGLAAALAAFGEITLSSKATAATVAVSASAVTESVLSGLVSAKTGVAAALAMFVAAAGIWQIEFGDGAVGPGGGAVATVGPQADSPPVILIDPPEKEVSEVVAPSSPPRDALFVHVAARGRSPGVAVRDRRYCEQWYYFPEGPGGPFLERGIYWDVDRTKPVQWWLNDGWAHCHVDLESATVRIRNCGAGYCRLHMASLPTDSKEFAQKVSGLEGQATHAMVDKAGFRFERDPVTGFVTRHLDGRLNEQEPFEARYDYSDLDLSLFEFEPPAGMQAVDERDEMHKRGWTYFRVQGQIDGRNISGVGRLPFVYYASKTHPPWLILRVDGRVKVVDTNRLACVLDTSGAVRKVFPGGSFFRGLARPWTGARLMDTLRRDAAQERVWLQIDEVEGSDTLESTLEAERGGVSCRLVSTLDLASDMVERVVMGAGQDWVFDRALGELTFTYLSHVEDVAGAFTEPEELDTAGALFAERTTVFWPLLLVDIDVTSEPLELADHGDGPSKRG